MFEPLSLCSKFWFGLSYQMTNKRSFHSKFVTMHDFERFLEFSPLYLRPWLQAVHIFNALEPLCLDTVVRCTTSSVWTARPCMLYPLGWIQEAYFVIKILTSLFSITLQIYIYLCKCKVTRSKNFSFLASLNFAWDIYIYYTGTKHKNDKIIITVNDR